MTKKIDWKIKREEKLETLLPWAQNKIRKLGYSVKIDGYAISFRVGSSRVLFYPFTGGIVWEGYSKAEGRGMKNLIKMIERHENTN